MRYLTLILIFVAMADVAFAARPRVNPRPRVMAMGDAQIAANGSEDSVSYNPASLNQIEGFHLQFPITMMIAPQVIRSTINLSELSSKSKPDSEKKKILRDFLADDVTTEMMTRINLFPNVAFKHFQIGLDLDAYASATNPDLAANQIVDTSRTYADAGVQAGTGWGFLDNTLEVGAGVKVIYSPGLLKYEKYSVATTAKAIDLETPSDEYFDVSKRALGLGFDAGVRYLIQPTEKYGWAGHPTLDGILTILKPAVALTYQDIANTRYFTSSDMKDIEQSVNLGFAIHPEIGPTKNTFAADFRGLNQDTDFLLKLHLGAECVLFKFLAARVGLEQGYVTGGLGLDFRFIRFDVYSAAYETARHVRVNGSRAYGFLVSAGI